jgi:two-component system chemotaxis sensor kinase CheA
MVSIGRIFKRAERAGRATARLAGKDVSFQSAGQELRLDKVLADAIVLPLEHLARNAVDHGIESPAERLQLGKAPRGLVRFEALQEGSQTRIRVSDDGRGIDAALVSRAARDSQLIDPDAVLDVNQSLRIIFRPGFSTATDVSATSGRGVGLDVVETNVEQVGGKVLVSTVPGRGVTFEIRLPVTFGLLAAMIVSSGGHRYCIDSRQVIRAQSYQEFESSVANSSAEKAPKVYLRDLLGQPAADTQSMVITCRIGNGSNVQEQQPHSQQGDRVPASTLNSPQQEFSLTTQVEQLALVVDNLEGMEEVLVRNLGSHAGRWYGIAGATELLDGKVALVLDLPRLWESR